MNRQNRIILVTALLMMCGTALALNGMRTHQRLTKPGVITKEIPGSQRLEIYLPEKVIGYDSTLIPTDNEVLRGLPHDTSFVQRRYSRPDHNTLWEPLFMNVVLMGTDRTSIHKPQFCLRGQGWDIDAEQSVFDNIRIEKPYPYELPVMKMLNTREVTDRNGNPVKIRGIYVYWFVADNDLTADHATRMRKMAMRLLRTGELERWAYVSCFAICMPGQEDATYARMKEFIAAAVPQFQTAANPPLAAIQWPQTALR